MQEFEQKILEQYDIEVSSTRKVRGAVLCETNKGLFLLKEITTSEKRIPALCELYTRLYEQGYHRIDYVVTNRNGEYISALDNGDRYILKKCFAGRECDIKKTREIFEAAGNLAKLHIIMRYELEHGIPEGTKTDEKYRRHNRELKKVRQFTRKVVPKGEFEFAFLKQFDQMYQWAEAAVEELDRSDYEKLYADQDEIFQTLFFMDEKIAVSKAKHAAKKIFEDPACGGVLRIKGFLQDGENWLELNATQHEISLKPIGAGQDVLIIIGEKLNEEKIRYYLE